MQPGFEAGRGEQVVQRHDESPALTCGEKILDGEHADFLEGRLLHRGDEAGEVGGLSVFPSLLENGGEQTEFAALQRVGIDPEESEQAGGRALDPLGEQFGVARHLGGRRFERAQNGERDPRVAPRRVDGDLALLAQGRNAFRSLTPLREAVLPFFRLGGREIGQRDAGLAGILLIDPRQKVVARHVRESEQEVSQVALRVDHQRGDAVHGGFLEQGKTQTRLAAPGHANAHAMGGQVARIVKQRRLAGLAVRVDLAAEVEKSEFFVKVGRHRSRIRVTSDV